MGMKEMKKSRKVEEKEIEVPEEVEVPPIRKRSQVSPAWTF